MRRKWGFKPSKRQQATAFNAAMDFLAAGSDNPNAINAPRLPVPKARAAPRQLEAPVVKAVGELLAVHPKVLFAVRQNSGAASYEAASGRYTPVFFYRILTDQPVTITDFWGLLRNGRPFALEAKAPGFKKPRDQREMRQALFISMIQNCGGLGGFVTSVDEAKELLEAP